MQSGPNAPAILDALGDPVRRLLYQRLARGPLDVSTLARGVPVSRSAVSHHLRVLRDCRLVTDAVDGRRRVYSVAKAGLAPLLAWIARMQAEGA